MYWILALQSVWTLTFPGPGGRGEELELPTGQETLTALRDGEGGGEGGGEWEGVGRRG